VVDLVDCVARHRAAYRCGYCGVGCAVCCVGEIAESAEILNVRVIFDGGFDTVGVVRMSRGSEGKIKNNISCNGHSLMIEAIG